MIDQHSTMDHQGPASLAPVAERERVQALDVLRGFALLGILAVNMASFSTPISSLLSGLTEWRGAADRAAAWLIRFLAEGKFYSLFSFLFGLGLTLQMARAEARGIAFGPLYARRLLVLLGIGLLHAYLIWIGDILVTYALLGFILLLFRRQPPRTLVIGAVVCLALPLLVAAADTGLVELAPRSPATAEINRTAAAAATELTARAAQARQVYATGSFAAITAQRARDLAWFYPSLLGAAPSILGMFLLGLAAGRRGIFQDIAAHRPLLRRVFGWGMVVGLAANFVYAAASEAASRMPPTWLTLVAVAAQTIGAPALALGYAAGLTLLAQPAAWRRRLAPLAAAGRLALSNYLLQSLVGTTIFYGYGLGLFGRVGPAAGLLVTIIIYLLQLPLSLWWLRRFQYGPVEWLWRSLTYGRRQPFQRPAGSAPARASA